jgi:hypothetical protein
MYARVVRWEGGTADAIEAASAAIAAESASEPPEGVPAKGFLLLVDPDRGRTMAVALFETEDDRATGDATLNAMSPPGEGLGKRAPVEMYDVAADLRVT